jgi:dihydrofolate reductase
MGKVIYDISTSLDGFIAGANVRPEAGWAGLGDGGERLHDWGFNSADPHNRDIAEALVANTGAVIVGRTTYHVSIANWGADGPIGSARIPTIVVSHSVPEDIPDGGVYIFVESVEAAHAEAKKAAGNKDIVVQGANTAQQLITRGLMDEIFIHLTPVLFGSGVRLFEHVGGEHVQLETVEVIETKEAIHLRFRVVK